jgi:hypothetical protein
MHIRQDAPTILATPHPWSEGTDNKDREAGMQDNPVRPGLYFNWS